MVNVNEPIVDASNFDPTMSGFDIVAQRLRSNFYDQWIEYLCVRKNDATLAVCAFEPLAEPPSHWFDEDGDPVAERTIDGTSLCPPAFYEGKPVSEVSSFVCGPLGISTDGCEVQLSARDDETLAEALNILEWEATPGLSDQVRATLLEPALATRLPGATVDAYLTTKYVGASGPQSVELRIGSQNRELARLYEANGARSATFVTAWNPEGKVISPAENERRNRLLLGDLERLSAAVIHGQGIGDGNDWVPEHSYLGLGVTFEQAVHLGRHYEQNAIVWAGEDAVPRLVLLR